MHSPKRPHRDLAAAAYKPRMDRSINSAHKAPDHLIDRIMPVADDLPEKVKADVDNLLKVGADDAANGKWSVPGKEAWQKVFADLKGMSPEGMSPENMFSELNFLGGAINQILAGRGAKNEVALTGSFDDKKGKTSFYMLLNGPNIDNFQNGIDALRDQETPTCIRAG